MKINFDLPILDLDGKPVEIKSISLDKDGKQVESSTLMTLKRVAIDAMWFQSPDDRDVGGEEKDARFKINMKISEGGEQEFTPEEVAKIKQLIGRACHPLVVGRAYEILNG